MTQPTLSGTIAFSAGAQGRLDIWRLKISERVLEPLTHGEGSNDFPRWSPDGSRLAFVSTRTGNPEIWLMNRDGSDPRQLTASNTFHLTPSWSPDGKKLAYCAGDTDGTVGLYIREVDTDSKPERLAAPVGIPKNPSWSADGSQLIFSAPQEGRYDIWSYDFKAENLRPLTDAGTEDLAPSFSPDGCLIAFISATLSYDGKVSRNYDLWVMDSDGGKKRRLTRGADEERSLAWSPDGRFLVYCAYSAERNYERLRFIDLISDRSATLTFDRAQIMRRVRKDSNEKPKPVEHHMPERPSLLGLLGMVPDTLSKMLYREESHGTERNPDWTD